MNYPHKWSQNVVYEFVDTHRNECEKMAYLCKMDMVDLVNKLINQLKTKNHTRFYVTKKCIKSLIHYSWDDIKRESKDSLTFVKWIFHAEYDKLLDIRESTLDNLKKIDD